MMFPLVGLNATALMASDGSWSVLAVQTGGAALIFPVTHTPPLTAPIATCAALFGSTATASIAPPSMSPASPVLKGVPVGLLFPVRSTLAALVIAPGPRSVQIGGGPRRSTESSRRLSSDSSEKSCRFGRVSSRILVERQSRLGAWLNEDFARVVVRRPFIVALLSHAQAQAMPRPSPRPKVIGAAASSPLCNF